MKTRGYFGIGAEGISKPMNFGNLARTAYGFGASFVFTLTPGRRIDTPDSDTPNSQQHMPWYNFDDVENIHLPDRCRLVGVELTEDAVDLPSFRHPTMAAYILGPENGSLSPEVMEKCEFVIKIPTLFCLNVATAGAIVMYDRIQSLGRFDERPVRAGGPPPGLEGPHPHLPKHVHGQPKYSGASRQKAAKGRNRLTVVGQRYTPEGGNNS
ncbi:MAG: RNA methyltransferase [Rhizobiaceae bacterium]|nr:RNA methyltransferase [Rhizobiaceae bacterium]